MATDRYDAVLLLSFGGPEGPDDVLPFLRNVTRGRDVPDERLEEVAAQYARFGGISPINEQCRALLDALRAELDRRGHDLPLVWGNRNWAPYLEDTVRDLTATGARRVLAVTTSAFSSYSACRQYLEDIDRATASVAGAPAIDKVRPYFNHPGVVDAVTDRVRTALGGDDARLVFTAHSIPLSMARTSDYEAQLRDIAGLVANAVGHDHWDLVWQSRSGPAQVPWLEPDIVDHLHALHDAGTDRVAVVPLGFTSDHMEVVYDLDTLAAAAAADLGITMIRVPTVGTHPAFVAALVDVLDEQLRGATPVAVGSFGPRPWPCAADCCPAPARPGRPPTT